MRLLNTFLLWAYAAGLLAEPTQKPLSPLGAQSLLETSGGLLLILLLIFGGAWLFRRFGQLPLGGRGLVTILGGAAVGPRERVVLVEVENTRLLLGVAPGQVRTLHLLTAEASETGGFAQQLQAAQADDEGPS